MIRRINHLATATFLAASVMLAPFAVAGAKADCQFCCRIIIECKGL